MATYALHSAWCLRMGVATPTIDGHEDPSAERRFEGRGFEAVVTGSWAC